MKTTIKAYPLYGEASNFKVMVHEEQYPTYEARLASALVERWGLVMGEPDGNDPAGRQQLKLMPVADVVERACETASVLTAAFAERGWLVQGPTIEECEQVAKKKEREPA